jgi:hypothetical protein
MFTVLGMDPGTSNFAYSVVEVGINPIKFNILTHRMLNSPIKEMSGLDVGQRLQTFAKEIRAIKRTYNVDFAVAERFMTRGHKGTTIEAVSAMLGSLSGIFKTDVCFITAAQWKNSINKQLNLDDLYVGLKPYGIPTHRIDAVCIGLYGATLALEEPHFSMLKSEKHFKQKIIESR